jgi:putative flippase GtrA
MIIKKSSFNYRIAYFFFSDKGRELPTSKYFEFVVLSYIFLILGIIVLSIFPIFYTNLEKYQDSVLAPLAALSVVCWIAFIIFIICSIIDTYWKKLKSHNITYEE